MLLSGLGCCLWGNPQVLTLKNNFAFEPKNILTLRMNSNHKKAQNISHIFNRYITANRPQKVVKLFN